MISQLIQEVWILLPLNYVIQKTYQANFLSTGSSFCLVRLELYYNNLKKVVKIFSL